MIVELVVEIVSRAERILPVYLVHSSPFRCMKASVGRRTSFHLKNKKLRNKIHFCDCEIIYISVLLSSNEAQANHVCWCIISRKQMDNVKQRRFMIFLA